MRPIGAIAETKERIILLQGDVAAGGMRPKLSMPTTVSRPDDSRRPSAADFETPSGETAGSCQADSRQPYRASVNQPGHRSFCLRLR